MLKITNISDILNSLDSKIDDTARTGTHKRHASRVTKGHYEIEKVPTDMYQYVSTGKDYFDVHKWVYDE